MRVQPSILTLRNNFDSLIAAIAGAVFIFLLTSYHGIGMSPDSVSYTGVARNITQGRWFIDFDDTPIIIFPMGYPTFLGILSMIFSKDVLVLAPWINASLIGLVIFINGCIIERFRQRSWWHKWAILSILPISFSLLDVYTMLWSETLFMVFLCLFIVYIKKYLSNPTLINLLLPALFTALACDTRIAGISILGTGLFLICIQKKLPWLQKLFHLFVYLVLGIAILLANLIRNQLESGTTTGDRQKSITPLINNIQYFGDTLLQWLQLPNATPIIAVSIGIIIILIFGIVFLYRYFTRDKISSFEIINITFCIGYVFFIVITSTISRYEKINNRLLAPAFIPLLLGISFYIPHLIRNIKVRVWRIIAVAAFAVIFFLFQYRQAMAALALHDEIKENGIPGYTELGWQESDIVRFLKDKKAFFKPGIDIYSNAADAVYFYNGLPVLTLPEPPNKKDLKEYLESDPNYAIIFTNDFNNPAIIHLDEIAKFRQLDTLVKLNDGIVLWSNPKK